MMDIPASPPSFSFPRITRRRRNTQSGASPSQSSPQPQPQAPPLLPLNQPSTAGPHSPVGGTAFVSVAPSPTTAQPSTQAPLANEADRQSYRIRLVPHLESARSLHFEPIIRDVRTGGPPLRVGRFTDRATNPPRGNGLNPNDRNSDKVAFRSKVVSRAHAELWVQGKGVFFLKDTKSSSGTFINHMRLSAPGQESNPHILKDGDIIQLGVDYQGGTEEMYRCVKIKVEVGQGREWQGGANAFNTAALKQLRTLQAVGGDEKGKGVNKKTVGDCCICLFPVSVCQSLFIAPCSHAFHYKCIRPLLELHHPGFSCPLCRTFADLDADVEIDESELRAIENALDEAEAEAEADGLPPSETHPNGLANDAHANGATVDDAILVDSDSGGSPVGRRTAGAGTQGGPAVVNGFNGPHVAASGPGPAHALSAAEEDRQVEDELEVDFDEDDDGDERMVSASADEFGGHAHEDVMDATFSQNKRGVHEVDGAAEPSSSRSMPLRIDPRRNDAEVQADREAREFADAATPLNNNFSAIANSLMGAIDQYPSGSAVPANPTQPFGLGFGLDTMNDEDAAHATWPSNKIAGRTQPGPASEGRGSSSGTGSNSPALESESGNPSNSNGVLGGARGIAPESAT